MNQIHKLAAECGISICPTAKGMLQVMCTIPELEEFAERSLAKEREACAEICDELKSMDYCVDVRLAADAIRARK